ncbi:MAG TPA: HNH endonuclease [Planctomycetaceae bacterium]|jgi:5-methylcytosine-specific restriction endonuclease McrA|nr:HNH endonuclease [Planctomycetaceae bacterium]
MSDPTYVVFADGCFAYEAPDLDSARRLRKEHGGEIAIAARGPWFTALADFIARNVESVGADAARADWRLAQLSIDPRCEYCARRVKFKNSTVDHRTPRIRGGEDIPENWALACNGCNQSKGQLTVDEFRDRVFASTAFSTEPANAA